MERLPDNVKVKGDALGWEIPTHLEGWENRPMMMLVGCCFLPIDWIGGDDGFVAGAEYPSSSELHCTAVFVGAHDCSKTSQHYTCFITDKSYLQVISIQVPHMMLDRECCWWWRNGTSKSGP